jgi:hypothetical protein
MPVRWIGRRLPRGNNQKVGGGNISRENRTTDEIHLHQKEEV